MTTEVIKGLQDAQKELGVVLVDDKGQLTYLGCMFVVSVHLSVINFLRGLRHENQNKN